ncbi:C-type lectin domain family 4 member E-like [Scyliorhinus torazame]|uniref:C-type lectin domain family 4 member E-like n=1 Tax=Scyliorhinus torazame TaxID=75743 RepID=UPI003B593EB6
MNQMSDASQNDQAIERQCADLLNRLLSESVRNQTNLEGMLQNLAAAFARTNDTANSFCNTFRNVSVLLVNQMLDAFQNHQTIERQNADLLNRTLSESEGKFQNLSSAFARCNETSNSLCNTLRDLSESRCPRGWKVHNQKCYIFSTDQRNWDDAKQGCECSNSHLIIINAPEQQNFIIKTVKDNKENYWIGLTDRAEEGKWKWVDGSTASFLKWQTGQPDNYEDNENCATISANTKEQKFGWNDDNCGKSHPFICEKLPQSHIAAADFEEFCS